jgi:hypothetical protein
MDPYAAEDILNERLMQAVDSGKLHDLQRLFNDKDLLKQLTRDKLTEQQLRFLDANSDKIKALLRDPRFQELLEDSLAARKQGQPLSDKQIETFKNLADNRLDPAALPPEPNATPAPVGAAQDGEKAQPQSGDDNRAEPTLPPLQPGGASEPKQSWLDRQLGRFANAVVDELNNAENSEALQNALRSLGGLKDGADGSQQLDLGGLWNSATEDMASWVSSKWDVPGELSEVPAAFYHELRSAIPEVGNSVNGALARLPNDPLTSPGSGVRADAVAWVVSALMLAAIGWQLLGRRVAAIRRADAEQLGPWPVEPGAVTSRDDLVRAFEYLAVLRLGAGARSSNHLAVASRLGEDEPESAGRAAADELARLYERARYAPEPGPLQESELDAARRDLTLLARAAAA